MITLDVHEYCHDCPGFDPIAKAHLNNTGNVEVEVTRVITVQCKSHKRCASIEKYITRWEKTHEELK